MIWNEINLVNIHVLLLEPHKILVPHSKFKHIRKILAIDPRRILAKSSKNLETTLPPEINEKSSTNPPFFLRYYTQNMPCAFRIFQDVTPHLSICHEIFIQFILVGAIAIPPSPWTWKLLQAAASSGRVFIVLRHPSWFWYQKDHGIATICGQIIGPWR